VIGTVQATEVVKLVLGIGEPLIGRLLTYDALGMRFREVRLRRDPNCPLCGNSPTITDLSIHVEGGAACAITPNGDEGRAAAPVGAEAALAGSRHA
jgi:adenylyltransferase/sulfurtransferase